MKKVQAEKEKVQKQSQKDLLEKAEEILALKRERQDAESQLSQCENNRKTQAAAQGHLRTSIKRAKEKEKRYIEHVRGLIERQQKELDNLHKELEEAVHDRDTEAIQTVSTQIKTMKPEKQSWERFIASFLPPESDEVKTP